MTIKTASGKFSGHFYGGGLSEERGHWPVQRAVLNDLPERCRENQMQVDERVRHNTEFGPAVKVTCVGRTVGAWSWLRASGAVAELRGVTGKFLTAARRSWEENRIRLQSPSEYRKARSVDERLMDHPRFSTFLDKPERIVPVERKEVFQKMSPVAKKKNTVPEFQAATITDGW
jgi:hypothetical protein